MSEKRTLFISIWVTLIFAIFGIVWGTFTDSGMIIFDGIYSGISLCLSYISVVVLKQVENAEDDRFPFGRAHFEPMLVLFKSLALIGTCFYSAVNSFAVLLAGGRYVAPDMGILYSLISTLGCLSVTLLLHAKNNKLKSGIVAIERKQWLGDFLLSTGVLAGFTTSFFLQDTRYSGWISYADPLMVVVFSTLFIFLILSGLGEPLRQLMFYRAKPKDIRHIEDAVQLIANEIGAKPKTHVVLVGRELDVEVNFLMQEGSFSVKQMDNIRNRLAEKASQISRMHWINVSFTAQEKWL